MTERTFEVVDSYPNDEGRAIARLSPNAIADLGVNPSDVLEIEGKGAETVAVKVWRSDRQEWNTETIRLDENTRQNAKIETGEQVTVRPVEAELAIRLVLTPLESRSVQLRDDLIDPIHRQILKRPVIEDSVIPVLLSTDHPFIRSPDRTVDLVAVETEPSGVVLISEETDVRVRTDE